MCSLQETMQKFGEIFDKSEAWNTVKENDEKNREEWERISKLEAYKTLFYGAVRDRGFDTSHVENFDAVANVIAEYMRNKECSRWIYGDVNRQKFMLPKRPKVGLLFMGAPGTGKTLLSTIIHDVANIDFIKLRDIGCAFQGGGYAGIQEKYPKVYTEDFIFDDLGLQAEMKHYAQAGYTEDLIFQRYDLWRGNQKRLTIISTNFVSFKDQEGEDGNIIPGIRSVFSNQAATRIEEMFLPILFHGACRREAAVKKFSEYMKPNYNGID